MPKKVNQDIYLLTFSTSYEKECFGYSYQKQIMHFLLLHHFSMSIFTDFDCAN